METTKNQTATSQGVAVRPIRVGIIGVGNWANYGHIPALQLVPGYEVVAVQSRRREAAEAAATKFGVRHVLDSVAEVANHPDVDLVAVLTTAPQHEEGIRAAIEAGKDVYSEWPFTTSTALAEELVALAQAAGVRHIIGLQRRLSPTTRYLHDLLQQGYVGRLRSVRLHVSMNYFQAVRSQSLRWTVPPADFSGVIPIYAGHFLDALFTAIGRPLAISSLLVNQFKEVTIAETGEVIPTTTPDELVLSGLLPGDAVLSVHIEGGKRSNSGVQLDITGDAGDLRITNVSAFGGLGEDYHIEGANEDNKPLRPLPVPTSYEWVSQPGLASAVLELAHLYAAHIQDVRTGTQVAPSFHEGLWLHRFFDLVEESSTKGIRVLVGDDLISKG